MTKVALQYGVATGHRVGARFRRALTRAGYEIVKDPNLADILIAHSAGCFWLPTAPTKQKLLLIDPPYWPGRSINERGKQRMKTWQSSVKNFDYSIHWWLRRTLWGAYYAVRDLKYTKAIMRAAQTYDLETVIKNHHVILVRNEHDDWLTPDLTPLTHTNKKLIIKHLPGEHDDCWAHPAPYIALLPLLN